MSDATEEATQRAVSDWEKPGTRKWFWTMRMANVMLFFLPLYPLATVVQVLMDPTALVRTDVPDVRGSAPQGRVTSVVVHLAHPTLYEYVLLVGPGVLACAAMALICRALYRITVNFDGNRCPYTDRDQQVLRYAGLVAGVIGMLFVVLLLLNSFHFHGGGSPDVLWLMIMTIVASAMTGYAKNLYTKGRTFYQEMEKGV